jgi:hypothetical protein
LWSIDLFRCESLSLRTHWVLVVMAGVPTISLLTGPEQLDGFWPYSFAEEGDARRLLLRSPIGLSIQGG